MFFVYSLKEIRRILTFFTYGDLGDRIIFRGVVFSETHVRLINHDDKDVTQEFLRIKGNFFSKTETLVNKYKKPQQ